MPTLSVGWLLRRYRSEHRRSKWRPIYENLLTDAAHHVEPAAIQKTYTVEEVIPLIDYLPAGTIAVVLGICTLGLSLEQMIARRAATDLSSAVILDEIALAYINSITREMHGEIRQEQYLLGRKTGPAYRPGVGRWPLESQKVVFDRLPAHRIGVSIDEHYWMQPVKSTSLIIPIIKQD